MVADYRKNSELLGTNWTQGIPIEVAPFAYADVLVKLAYMGSPTTSDPSIAAGKTLNLRMGKAKAGPVVSDNGNFIIDAPFGPEKMSKPKDLLRDIKLLTGVVEVGLFCDMAEAAYFGNADGTVSVRNVGSKTLETIGENDIDLSSQGAAQIQASTLNRKSSGKGASIQEEKLRSLRAYTNDEGHFSLVRNFRLADMITISNAVCGTLSIFSCIHYLSLTANLPTAPSDAAIKTLYLAHLFPILGFGFDAADGRVARWTGGGSLLGQELDSLADLVSTSLENYQAETASNLLCVCFFFLPRYLQISFGVAPATLAYTLGLRLPLDIAALLLFVSAGLARLARYNATVALTPTKSSGSVAYFSGIPIPSSLGLTAFMAFCVKSGWFLGANGDLVSKLAGAVKHTAGGKVAEGINKLSSVADLPLGTKVLFGEAGGWGEIHVLSFVFALWGAAMVSKTLKIPKL